MKRRDFVFYSLPFLVACTNQDESNVTVEGLIASGCKVALSAASVVELVSIFFPGAVSLSVQQAKLVAEEYCKRFDQQIKPQRLQPGQDVDVTFDDGTTISGKYLGDTVSQ